MAARSFFPAERPSEELSLLASFLGVLPAEKSSSEQQLYSSTRSWKPGPASSLQVGDVHGEHRACDSGRGLQTERRDSGSYNTTVLSKQMSVSVRSTITMSVSKISRPSCSRQNTAHRWSSAHSRRERSEEAEESGQNRCILSALIRNTCVPCHPLLLVTGLGG